MATAATPVITWAATIQAGVAIGQSGSFTFTVNLTQAWQYKIPIQIFFPTNVSAGPQINVYRSTDGGVSYDSVPLQPLGLPRQSGTSQRISLKLETGQYVVQVLVGGGPGTGAQTWSVNVNTQELITAILNQ
jgi:hypothetical protein